jgi:hypothetical protein
MKNILYILLALSLVTISCKNRKAAKEKAKTEAQIKEESKLPVSDKTENLSPEQAKLEPDDRQIGVTLISISKSVCFGVCPAYSAQIFKDGTLIYEGIKDVENIGKFKGKVSLNELNSTIEEVSNIGFFSLDAVYDNKNVTDLPTTVTYVNYQGKAKKVVCRFDCDPRITKANKVIEALVKSTSLNKIE